jgi:4-carboxymuconolactone decarboxylase
MARIPQIAGKTDVPEPYQYVVDQVLEVFGRVRGPFSILLHSPALAERLLPMVPFNRTGSIVEAPLRLIGILATVREKDAAYVWAAQVRSARENGVREGTIDVLRAG